MIALRGYGGLTFHTACSIVIIALQEMYPDLAKLGQIALTIPVSSVPAERGFSLQNRMETALSEEKVTRLMRIASCEKGLDEFNFPEAVKHFQAVKMRRK